MMRLFRRLRSAATHKIFDLPVLVLMPHSRCNCRCVMCDIWKANHEKREIAEEDLQNHLQSFKRLGVRRVALSGGEALMHTNLWKFCQLLHSLDAKISLLTTGVTLKHHAAEIVKHCDEVIVSLDGSRETHNRIRNIPSAFEKLKEGIIALKSLEPGLRITGRTVLQKKNFREFSLIIRTAKDLGLHQISFLGADISSEAFNRPNPWAEEKISEVALDSNEADELKLVIEKSFQDFSSEYNSRFIAESRSKITDIYRHYKAISGHGPYPKKKCNAPWVSAVIESNGDVLPCFFHKAYGNIHRDTFEGIINSKAAILFRKNLDVTAHPTCQRCVCSLHVGLTQEV